jgi:hypothetical protein
MMIKFLSNGTGDPRLAASYLIGEQDHLGNKRAGVEIVRGDPIVFAAIASSLKFQYCYTSVVIAWSPEDNVLDEHLNEVLDLFEEHAFAGLNTSQYHMTAVIHADDDGSKHLHILIPRVELTTEKSLNVAPPGHLYYFDPLRDFLNHKYGWARPDDLARMKTTKPKNHHALQNAAAVKAKIQGQVKKTRVEMIDAYIEQRIMLGSINNREELVQSLKEIGKIGQVVYKSISLKYKNTRDRLEGAFYHAEFSFSAYRENRTRRKGIQTVSAKSQNNSTEYAKRLAVLFEGVETVRRKRAEYNQKYYRPKVPQNEENSRQAAEISYELGVTVSADISRETNRRHRVNSLSNQNRDAVSRLDAFDSKSTASIENIPKRECNTATSTPTEHGSISAVQQRAKGQYPANDGVSKRFEQFFSEPRFEFGHVQQKNLGSIRRDSSSTGDDTAIIKQNYMGSWDIRRIQYPLTNQKYYLNIGVTHERNTATNSKKSIDHTTTAIDSSIREKGKDRARKEFESTTGHRCPDSINQRTRELAKASAQLARDIEERKLSLEQNIERQRVEAESTRAYVKAVSRGNTERIFIERTNRFFGNIKEQIRNTFRKFIDQITDTTADRSTDRSTFETVSQDIDSVGIDRLVSFARRCIKRRELNDNLKEDEQQTELTAHHDIVRRMMSCMSDELKNIQVECPQFNLKRAIDSAMNAEEFCNKFYLRSEVHKLNRLDLDAYVFYISECLDELKVQFQILDKKQLELLDRFSNVIELHLDQFNHNNMNETSLDYQSTQLEVKDLVKTFRYDLINKVELLNPKLSLKIDKTIDRPSENSYDEF